jgi:hypothetical protein
MLTFSSQHIPWDVVHAHILPRCDIDIRIAFGIRRRIDHSLISVIFNLLNNRSIKRWKTSALVMVHIPISLTGKVLCFTYSGSWIDLAVNDYWHESASQGSPLQLYSHRYIR